MSYNEDMNQVFATLRAFISLSGYLIPEVVTAIEEIRADHSETKDRKLSQMLLKRADEMEKDLKTIEDWAG